MRLEPELWEALEEICRREQLTLTSAVQAIETRWADLGQTSGRTSAVRVHIVNYFRDAATEMGHATARHGALPDRTAIAV